MSAELTDNGLLTAAWNDTERFHAAIWKND
jgi:hypothetical protein